MISRDTHRHIKGLNREQMSKYLYEFYVNAYYECLNDFEAAMFRRLADDFGFTAEKIEEMRKGVNEDIESIQLKLITANEIVDGLISEGKFKKGK